MLKFLSVFGVVVIMFVFSGCVETVIPEDLNGEWIAENIPDTLYIVDDSNFYHSNESMHYDHYDYSVEGNSLLIGYSGKMMIFVKKTKHEFELQGDDLTIDFSNEFCFGFPKEKINYKRTQKFILE
ncbi:MAG: hypothetical protein DSY82_08040 [Flavobacteriia bacterium]|nr:MAG: hypothetical protein DSY82_08040 [Flavobacteriia bacterium]